MSATKTASLRKGLRLISPETGVLRHILRLPRMAYDPRLVSFGVWPADSTRVGGFRFGGRSSGCGNSWEDGLLTTVGEDVERYCPAFYDRQELVFGSYDELAEQGAVDPASIALYHERQYQREGFPILPFTNDLPVHWTSCYDLLTGKRRLYPGSLMYIP